MPLSYANLDAGTRRRMLAEIALDRAAGTLYLSDWLSPAGKTVFPDLLQHAAKEHDDGWLALEISFRDLLRPEVEPAMGRLLAEGEFNRFYMCALCRHAINEGQKLKVYRAKAPEVPRAALESRIGQVVEPEELLGRLREGGWSSSLLKPGAGLSVKLVSDQSGPAEQGPLSLPANEESI